MDIDQNTIQSETIKKAIEAFDLPPDYNEIELEITFKDGTSKEYNDKK